MVIMVQELDVAGMDSLSPLATRLQGYEDGAPWAGHDTARHLVSLRSAEISRSALTL
jgi:hypothetical protein